MTVVCAWFQRQRTLSVRPHITLQYVRTESRLVRLIVVNVEETRGTMQPLTESIEAGSQTVGAGLLVRAAHGSLSHIHQAVHLPMQGKLRSIWVKVTIVNRQSGWTIETDIPVSNVVRDENVRAGERSRLSRATEVADMLMLLTDRDS